MGKLEQVVERDEKPVLKIFLVFIGLIVLTNFIIYIMDMFTEKIPYISTLSTIVLVIVSCTFILVKYFSKYSYVFDRDSITFNRTIGKREFHMLTVDYKDLIYIRPTIEEDKEEKYAYKFIFPENEAVIYRGEFKGENNVKTSFLFSPNENVLRELKAIIK